MKSWFVLSALAIVVATAGGAFAVTCANKCKQISIYKKANTGECVYFSDTYAATAVFVDGGLDDQKIVNYDPGEEIKTYYKANTCDACTYKCDSPQGTNKYEANGTVPSGATTDCDEFPIQRTQCVPRS